MDMCIKELHTRFMISMPNWLIKAEPAPLNYPYPYPYP